MEVDRETLEAHLFSLPDQPDLIPYRTSYYTRQWGFCVQHSVRERLTESRYRVKVDADLSPGSLTYGEYYIAGNQHDEVLIYTHVCHPSLCNDNLTGIAVAAALGRWISEIPTRRYSYRIVFAPGTIGSIVWLSQNKEALSQIAHGLVIGLLGDNAPFTYKRSRHGQREIDHVVEHVIMSRSPDARVIDFSPYGYDERQFGSPGINLPMGRLTCSENGGYPEYHTSADNLDLVSEDRLQEAFHTVTAVVQALEDNRYYRNLAPFGEPQLGRRGLYRPTGGAQIAERESAMLWLLNQSNGNASLLDISIKSRLNISDLAAVARELVAANLLEEVPVPTG
jgi:aminopeptidase-like protein